MSHDDLEVRLRGLETSVALLNQLVTTNLKELTALTKVHSRTLFSASHEDPGLILRLDRIEGAEQRRSWMTKTALGAAVVAIIGTVSKFILR